MHAGSAQKVGQHKVNKSRKHLACSAPHRRTQPRQPETRACRAYAWFSCCMNTHTTTYTATFGICQHTANALLRPLSAAAARPCMYDCRARSIQPSSVEKSASSGTHQACSQAKKPMPKHPSARVRRTSRARPLKPTVKACAIQYDSSRGP